MSILPSPSISVNHIEHFNTIMWLNSYLNFSQLGIVLDNQACYRYAKQFLGMNKCSYKDVNSIIANLYSNLTSTFRFNSLHKDETITPFYLTDLLTECVPYHQINSLYASVVPIKPYVRKRRIYNAFKTQTETSGFNKMINKDFEDDLHRDTPKGSPAGSEECLPQDDFADCIDNSAQPDEFAYIDCRSGFNSKNQLLCIEPIDKFFVGAHVTARGKELDYTQIRQSAINQIVDPKDHELEEHELAMDKWVKEANKKNKNQRRYPQYDPDNLQEDLYKFKYKACNCICVDSSSPVIK